MAYYLDLTSHKEKKITPLSEKFRGKDPQGNEISFTNYYMELNGQPFFGISGECHYSRVHENQWEDTILKMKMGGINIVSSYCFWNHHEEEEGVFNFEGRRNIRKFIQLCHIHGMYVIMRIGPFCHGEARNGGLPDWLYGKPFEARSLDPDFLYYTKEGIWKGIEIEWTGEDEQIKSLPVKEVGRFRYTVEIPEGYENCKQALLQVEYIGDIGNAFVDGELIADNFYNGAVWEIGLKDAWHAHMGREITFVITPIKENVRIDVSSTMAGRMEKNEGVVAELKSVKVKPIYGAVFQMD